MAKRFLKILVRAISEENADGREMLNKSYVTVDAPQPRHGQGLWGVYLCVCVRACAHVHTHVYVYEYICGALLEGMWYLNGCWVILF